jgi:hypothetical protein
MDGNGVVFGGNIVIPLCTFVDHTL